MWRGDPAEIENGLVDKPYGGVLGLLTINRELLGKTFADQVAVFFRVVDDLVARGLVQPNPVTATILGRLDELTKVGHMAEVCGLSPRQLQRVLKQTTGFAPHDFLKVLRIQQSFRKSYLDYYADQAHFIHSFRQVTGYTPKKFRTKFDV